MVRGIVWYCVVGIVLRFTVLTSCQQGQPQVYELGPHACTCDYVSVYDKTGQGTIQYNVYAAYSKQVWYGMVWYGMVSRH